MAEFPDSDSRNVLEPGCSRCPALAESRECISWGNGSLDADVVVVGEAPAFGNPEAEEWRGGNWTGMAYTSRHSGRAVRDLFADAGLDSEDFYFTNAVKCFPAAEGDGETGDGDASDDGRPTNREPSAEERANCRHYLRTEVEQVGPSIVATTGKHAALSVLGDLPNGFLDAVLEPRESAEFGTTVLPLLHPSYQNVWLPRIGFSREEYVAAIGEQISARR